ncbi:hypothetical protein ACOSQ4_025651 [Xanthoceras sorbifolium]
MSHDSHQGLVTTTQMQASLCIYADSGGEETFFDCYSRLPSDSEDDFRSDNSDFSRSFSSSPRRRVSFRYASPPLNKNLTRNETNNSQQGHSFVKEEKKLYQLFDDPFWSDLVADDHHHEVVTVTTKEIEVVDLLQDSLLNHQVIADPDTLHSRENAHGQNPKGSSERVDQHGNSGEHYKVRCICIPSSFLRLVCNRKR